MLAVDQDNVASDSKRWSETGQLNGFIGSTRSRHQGSTRDNAAPVQFVDGSIDTRRQSEIVGVHDKLAHEVSLPSGFAAPSASWALVS